MKFRVTTDSSLEVAKFKAVRCGIISEKEMQDSEVCMEGPDFFNALGGLCGDELDTLKVGN